MLEQRNVSVTADFEEAITEVIKTLCALPSKTHGLDHSRVFGP